MKSMRHLERFRALIIFGIIASLFSSSCLTTREIRPHTMQSTLNKGDLVRVVTKDGRDLVLRIVEINDRVIIGESYGKNHQIYVNEILKLEKHEKAHIVTTILWAVLLTPVAVVLFFKYILGKDINFGS